MKHTKVTLVPLTEDDREQFILDNQWAFKHGAMIEFGERDDHLDFDGEIISRKTVEHCIDDEAQLFMAQWEKIARAMEHRPFQPDSEQHRRFVEQTKAKVAALKERYPYIEVEEVGQLTR